MTCRIALLVITGSDALGYFKFSAILYFKLFRFQ